MEKTPDTTNEKYKNLAEIKASNPILNEYIDSSREFYSMFGIDLDTAIYNEEAKELTFSLMLSEKFQAHKNKIHGGMSSLLLDTAAGIVGVIEAGKEGKEALTAILNTKYLEPMLPNVSYNFTGRLNSADSRIISTEGVIKDDVGVEYATAILKMVPVKKS